MVYLKKNLLETLTITFVFLNIFLWYVVYTEMPSDKMTVAFLNVGQGDAIYIESPTHNQLLIDGGSPHKIAAELGGVMHFYDRTIDMLLVTNPDADHIGGFIDVLRSYHVRDVIEPGTKNSSATYAELGDSIKEEPARNTLARRGMVIHLGGGADLHILFPDKDVSDWKTNDGSVIAKLTYGATSVMFTGDAPSGTEEYTTSLDPSIMKSTILKAGHHGSRTSVSEMFMQAVSPQYAIISAGTKNKYGHPHKETLDLFQKLKIPVLGTYKLGRIVATSDGREFSFK